MQEFRGVYIISVAARLLEMHPQTLRKYERFGFVAPGRAGPLRLYSDEDIARLRLIKHLVDDLGLNLAGVELALQVLNRLLDLRHALRSSQEWRSLRQHAVEEIDEVLQDMGALPAQQESE
ncbi:MAG: MerR family transcriptional regulator [Chloroflexi bacterium]|nr:MerR family transcriptional regulator [Chloroflexota bacterium]